MNLFLLKSFNVLTISILFLNSILLENLQAKMIQVRVNDQLKMNDGINLSHSLSLHFEDEDYSLEEQLNLIMPAFTETHENNGKTICKDQGNTCEGQCEFIAADIDLHLGSNGDFSIFLNHIRDKYNSVIFQERKIGVIEGIEKGEMRFEYQTFYCGNSDDKTNPDLIKEFIENSRKNAGNTSISNSSLGTGSGEVINNWHLNKLNLIKVACASAALGGVCYIVYKNSDYLPEPVLSTVSALKKGIISGISKDKNSLGELIGKSVGEKILGTSASAAIGVGAYGAYQLKNYLFKANTLADNNLYLIRDNMVDNLKVFSGKLGAEHEFCKKLEVFINKINKNIAFYYGLSESLRSSESQKLVWEKKIREYQLESNKLVEVGYSLLADI